MGVKVDIVKAKKDYVSLCNQVLKSGKNQGKCYGVQNSKPCYANSDLKIAPIRQYLNKLKKEYEVIQYVGIAADEPKRLENLRGSNKLSLLEKYGYTEQMSRQKCEEYELLSPCYQTDRRGGCFFCFNASIKRFIHIRKYYPSYWQAFKELYFQTNSPSFRYSKTLEQVECEMDDKELMDNQPTLF